MDHSPTRFPAHPLDPSCYTPPTIGVLERWLRDAYPPPSIAMVDASSRPAQQLRGLHGFAQVVGFVQKGCDLYRNGRCSQASTHPGVLTLTYAVHIGVRF